MIPNKHQHRHPKLRLKMPLKIKLASYILIGTKHDCKEKFPKQLIALAHWRMLHSQLLKSCCPALDSSPCFQNLWEYLKNILSHFFFFLSVYFSCDYSCCPRLLFLLLQLRELVYQQCTLK